MFALLVVGGGITINAAHAHAAPTPATTVVRGCDGSKLIRPQTLSSIYCGDAGIIVARINWLAWTDGWALGQGTEYRKRCVPDCATGGVDTRQVWVWLFAPVRGNFTKVSLLDSLTDLNPDTHQLTGYVPNR